MLAHLITSLPLWAVFVVFLAGFLGLQGVLALAYLPPANRAIACAAHATTDERLLWVKWDHQHRLYRCGGEVAALEIGMFKPSRAYYEVQAWTIEREISGSRSSVIVRAADSRDAIAIYQAGLLTFSGGGRFNRVDGEWLDESGRPVLAGQRRHELWAWLEHGADVHLAATAQETRELPVLLVLARYLDVSRKITAMV